MNSTPSSKTRSVLVFAALTLGTLAPAGAQLVGQLGVLDLAANGGINPATSAAWQSGDTYRLVFVTSGTTTCDSTDIATYNTFVQGLADAAGLSGAAWNVVGSTATVDARDNTNTNPSADGVGEPVFRMDGAFAIANDYADLWNGINNTHAAGENYLTVHLDENRNVVTDERVRTGSTAGGVAATDGRVLGGATEEPPRVQTGRNYAPDFYGGLGGGNWMQDWSEPAANAGRVYAMSNPLTVVDVSDGTPPTLDSVNIVDDKTGGPVEVGETVTYTVTFSEAMDALTIEAADFENNSGATATISVDSVSSTGDPAAYHVVVTPTGTGTLNLQVKAGAELKDVAGNALDTALAIADDTTITVTADLTAPTVVSFDDDVSGGPILIGASVAYTVTFSEAMNATTVETADFENNPIDTAAITVDSVAPTGDAAVFVVTVTATGAGTLNLQVAADATLLDTAGNAVAAGTANPDDTLIDVNDPDNTAPTVIAFDDSVDGGPVNLGDAVIYAVIFSEDMDATTVNEDDFENSPTGTATITVDSVAATGDPAVFDVTVTTTGTGSLQLQIASGATLQDPAGNALVPASASPDDDIIQVETDTTAPTVGFTSNNVGGGPILETTSVTYTLTFSEAMDAGTIGIDDFENNPAATSTITVDGVSATGDPAVFQVTITATTPGTIILQIGSGADMRDLANNALDTNSAITDSATIQVNSLPNLTGELGLWSPAANGGINPATGQAWAEGDTYRLVFVTSVNTTCDSTEIATYNTFVQGLANAAGLGDVTWSVVGSTATVDARDNTNTNPTVDGVGEPILRMDGTFVIANDYADLWNGINNSHVAGENFLTVHLDESGVERIAERVRTGSTAGGVAATDGRVLGGSTEPTPRVQTGRNYAPDFYGSLGGGNWMQDWSETAASPGPVFAMSGPLTIGSGAEPPRITSFTSLGGGSWELTLVGEPDTAYEFRSSPLLDFDPGTLVENLMDGVPVVGTIGGANDSVLTTDSNGDGTARIVLAGPAQFIRAQTPGPLLSENFDAAPGLPADWEANVVSGTGTAWEVGDPTGGFSSGPVGGANSASHCAGTNISTNGGEYTASVDVTLTSPSIAIPAGSGALLSFQQFVDTDLANDFGSIRILDASDNTFLGSLEITEIEGDGTGAEWTTNTLEMPAGDVGGKDIKVEFKFVSDGGTQYGGFYVDDVTVTTL